MKERLFKIYFIYFLNFLTFCLSHIQQQIHHQSAGDKEGKSDWHFQVPITTILFFWEDCELISSIFLKEAIKTDGWFSYAVLTLSLPHTSV